MEFVSVDVLTSLILDASIIMVGTCMSDFVMLLGSVVVEFIFLVESRHVILNVSCISRILFVVPLRRRQKWLKATRRGDIVVELLGSYYVYFLFFLLDFAC